MELKRKRSAGADSAEGSKRTRTATPQEVATRALLQWAELQRQLRFDRESSRQQTPLAGTPVRAIVRFVVSSGVHLESGEPQSFSYARVLSDARAVSQIKAALASRLGGTPYLLSYRLPASAPAVTLTDGDDADAYAATVEHFRPEFIDLSVTLAPLDDVVEPSSPSSPTLAPAHAHQSPSPTRSPSPAPATAPGTAPVPSPAPAPVESPRRTPAPARAQRSPSPASEASAGSSPAPAPAAPATAPAPGAAQEVPEAVPPAPERASSPRPQELFQPEAHAQSQQSLDRATSPGPTAASQEKEGPVEEETLSREEWGSIRDKVRKTLLEHEPDQGLLRRFLASAVLLLRAQPRRMSKPDMQLIKRVQPLVGDYRPAGAEELPSWPAQTGDQSNAPSTTSTLVGKENAPPPVPAPQSPERERPPARSPSPVTPMTPAEHRKEEARLKKERLKMNKPMEEALQAIGIPNPADKVQVKDREGLYDKVQEVAQAFLASNPSPGKVDEYAETFREAVRVHDDCASFSQRRTVFNALLARAKSALAVLEAAKSPGEAMEEDPIEQAEGEATAPAPDSTQGLVAQIEPSTPQQKKGQLVAQIEPSTPQRKKGQHVEQSQLPETVAETQEANLTQSSDVAREASPLAQATPDDQNEEEDEDLAALAKAQEGLDSDEEHNAPPSAQGPRGRSRSRSRSYSSRSSSSGSSRSSSSGSSRSRSSGSDSGSESDSSTRSGSSSGSGSRSSGSSSGSRSRSGSASSSASGSSRSRSGSSASASTTRSNSRYHSPPSDQMVLRSPSLSVGGGEAPSTPAGTNASGGAGSPHGTPAEGDGTVVIHPTPPAARGRLSLAERPKPRLSGHTRLSEMNADTFRRRRPVGRSVSQPEKKDPTPTPSDSGSGSDSSSSSDSSDSDSSTDNGGNTTAARRSARVAQSQSAIPASRLAGGGQTKPKTTSRKSSFLKALRG